MDRLTVLPPPNPTPSRWTVLRLRVSRWFADAAEQVAPRRRIALVVAAILVALLATPPVRATVAEWFGFGGVVVERSDPERGPAPPPPEVREELSQAEAAAEVGFPVYAPAELGAPDGVEVAADRRMVSMSWATEDEGVLRLDQFDARLDFNAVKRSPEVYYANVSGTDALWFEEPHEVALLEPDGRSRTESARLAGHTLIWQHGVTTLRLEADVSLERAVEIAESVAPVS
jgi:hypothetical protein